MRRWHVYAAFCAAVVAVLLWASDKVLDLEHSETRAKAKSRYQEKLRTALWRMDTRFSLILSREATRPYTDYEAFPEFRQQVYMKRDLGKVQPGELIAPSPLLKETPDYTRLHFNVDARGHVTSPQVPQGVLKERAQLDGLVPENLDRNIRELEHVQAIVGDLDLQSRVRESQRWTAQRARSNRRAQQALDARKARKQEAVTLETVTLSPLEPIWRNDDLLFVRQVTVGKSMLWQGFLADWPALRSTLLAEVSDLFPDAELERARGETDQRLFTLPAVLRTPGALAGAGHGWTGSHNMLLIVWAVVVIAMGWTGVALRRSHEYAERQRAFASNVTHELRSPLTTFRLYADLLAGKAVADETKVAGYHRTLQREAARMAQMVENVIAYSRLESGRAQLTRKRILLKTLLEQIGEGLRARAQTASMELSVDVAGVHEVAMNTDAGAVDQILFNLVENACKYGGSPIHVGAGVHGGSLKLRVRDHGPGVPAAVVRRIFRPFERGGRDETDAVRGLGLGLALSRGLARDLGGDLTYESAAGGGACFVLSLPVAG